MKSFALVKRPVNASIKLIGVGKNYQLYFQQHLSSSWGHVISSGIVSIIFSLISKLLTFSSTRNVLKNFSTAPISPILLQIDWIFVVRNCKI